MKVDQRQATEFSEKAAKHLAWCCQHYRDMEMHGKRRDYGEVERSFHSALMTLTSAVDALEKAATHAGASEWQVALKDERERDPLLRWLWHARNSQTHDTIVKWRPAMQTLKVELVDEPRVRALMHTFYRPKDERELQLAVLRYVLGIARLDSIPPGHPMEPLLERAKSAGISVKMSLDSLVLCTFQRKERGNVVTVIEPHEHLGKSIAPCAYQAVGLALDYYCKAADELGLRVAQC